MFYEITGIKEHGDESINIHILIDHESPRKLRDSLQVKGIIILGIKESFMNEKTWWKIRASVTLNQNKHDIILQEEEPFEAAVFLFLLGLDVLSLNFIGKEISKEKSDKIISDAKDQVNIEVSEQNDEIDEKKIKSWKLYEDKELKKIQRILDEIFLYLQKLYPKIDWIIIPERITRIHKLEEQLRKLKMWRNPIKIKEILVVLFKLLDKINIEYLLNMEKKNISSNTILDGSQIIERELIDEYQKFRKSEIIKTLDIKRNKSDKYYIFTEKNWIFLKFLKKDIIYKLKDYQLLWYKAFDLLQFMFVVICVELWLLLRWQQILWTGIENQQIFIVLIHLWILAILIFGLSFFRKKNLWILLLLIFVWIWLYFLVSTIVTMSFAL